MEQGYTDLEIRFRLSYFKSFTPQQFAAGADILKAKAGGNDILFGLYLIPDTNSFAI